MIKCVAIDDEPIALSILQEYCRKYGEIELKCFTSPIEGMECVESFRPDIVFLDIEMNSHNGLELAKSLPAGTCLIFTTAFSQYALEGFEMDAIDFLHKPIFYPRFERSMEKALKWIDKNAVIDIDDVLFIEAMDNYVKVYRKDKPMVLSQITMKEMEEKLPGDRFFRVHRSFIVSLNAIEQFSNRKIFIRNNMKPIPVGRKYIDSFKNIYNIRRRIK